MQTISCLRSIVKYFRKSSFAKRHLTVFCIYVDIKTGLVSVGDTRFLTLYHSGSSVEKCLLPIKELVKRKVLTLTSVCVYSKIIVHHADLPRFRKLAFIGCESVTRYPISKTVFDNLYAFLNHLHVHANA